MKGSELNKSCETAPYAKMKLVAGEWTTPRRVETKQFTLTSQRWNDVGLN